MKRQLAKSMLIAAMLFASLLVIIPNVQAADSLYYPSQTPQTTFDPGKFDSPYTTVTVDVTPKLDTIPPGSSQIWTITVTYAVTAAGAGKVDKAQVRELEIVWANDLGGGYSIITPQGGVVTGPIPEAGNKWDVFVEKTSGYFNEGTVFVLTFHITSPDSLAPGTYHLVKTWHRSFGDFGGQESSSDYGIVIIFNVGPNHNVPEIPFGPVVATISMVAAFGAYFGFKKQRHNMPHL